jgi:hypothetical protein
VGVLHNFMYTFRRFSKLNGKIQSPLHTSFKKIDILWPEDAQVFTKSLTEIMSKFLRVIFISLALYIVILLDDSEVYIGTE